MLAIRAIDEQPKAMPQDQYIQRLDQVDILPERGVKPRG